MLYLYSDIHIHGSLEKIIKIKHIYYGSIKIIENSAESNLFSVYCNNDVDVSTCSMCDADFNVIYMSRSEEHGPQII